MVSVLLVHLGSTVITLEVDLYHIPAPSAGIAPSMAQSTLINEQGRFTDGPTPPSQRILQRYTISLPLGVHHLIRATHFQLTDNPLHALNKYLNVTLIKFDLASRHLPLLVDSIQILSDQRYSFLLTANQPISNYWPGFHAD